MTRKDYELFASVIYPLEVGIVKSAIIKLTSRVFKKDNFNFDEKKYKLACKEG